MLRTNVINDLNGIGSETIEIFYGKELQKTNQKEFSIEKIIKRKETTRQMERP